MKFKNILKDNKLAIVSFFIAASIMFFIYVFNGMILGEYISMRSDFLTGYIPILKNTASAILNGDNIFFSFASCLGLNNIFYLANIIFSPFNILYLVLYNVDENIVTIIVVMLKAGCIAASFNFFSRKILNNNQFSSVIISCFYSLCAYTVAYGTIVIQWLDAMLILPLLCVAIVDCFKNNKRVWLIILYVYLFISQFYIAYMVGIFSLVVVLLYAFIVYEAPGEHPLKNIIDKIANWALCVVVAVLLSAFVWVPTLFFILGNRASDSSEVIEIEASLLQIANSFFWGMGYNISGTFGYLYCGIPALICAPLFLCSEKINKKEKIFTFIIISIFMLCMVSTHLNLFLHVFDQPDFFFYRYSFVISFSVCAAASRYLGKEDELLFKPVCIVVSCLILLYLFIEQTISIWNLESSLKPFLNDNFGFLINVALMALWLLIFWLSTAKKINKRFLIPISILLLSVEVISGSSRMIDGLTYKSDYYSWYDFTETTINEIKKKDSGLYRIVYTNNITNNTDSWFSYNGITDFGDQEKMKVRDFLSNIGFASSPRYIGDTGYNEVSDMILGIKYNIIRPYKGVNFEENEFIGDGYYETNDNILNIGYLVDGDLIFYQIPGRNVFENLNGLTKTMTGIDKDCFVPVQADNVILDKMGIEIGNDGNTNYLYKDGEGGSLYITALNDGYEEAYFQLENDKSVYDLKDFVVVGARNVGEFLNIPVSLSTSNRMYYNSEKDRFHIVINSGDFSTYDTIDFNNLNVYYLDKDALESHFNDLCDGQLEVTEWKEGYIKGTVHVGDYRRYLFTTIPYDPGWSVFINGEEAEITSSVNGTFLGVLLPSEGDYSVEFKYVVPGLKIGIWTSILGIIAFLAVVFEKNIKEFEKRK